uniref:Uncharacterized protein n=1 Tax=Arcella intermedia TaxID=1963864 RepID=A0A6B2LSZ6_9EUKA
MPEVRYHCPDASVVVVGTKVDLRGDLETIERLKEKSLEVVSYLEGFKFAQEVKAVKYLEVSARSQDGLKALFDEAIRVVLNKNMKIIMESTISSRSKLVPSIPPLLYNMESTTSS